MHGAHRAARHQLPVHALGQAAFLEGEQDGAFRIRHRRHRHISDTFAMLGGGKVDVAFGGGGVALGGLGQQLEQRRMRGDQIGQGLLAQDGQAGIEELLRSRIGVDDFVVW